jgi:lipoate-protein ligase A
MYFANLGRLPGQQSMLVFHALARMGFEGLVFVSPKDPLASIGYFQDARAEVDLDYCREVGIPVMRREVGGGATYLDEDQIFYQVIYNKESSRAPARIAEIYEWFSQAPVETYREFGINASFRPVNDIVTSEGKKIAGEGGGDIADSRVFVGGILMDFDFGTMVKILKVPDEKFRDKVFKTLEENLTTMRRELGTVPPREDIKKVLKGNFEKLLGRLEPVELTEDVIHKMTELERWFTSDEFLFKKTPRIPKGVKIREGVEILYSMYKAKGGLIRTAQEVENKRIADITISGDFTMFPREALSGLESELKNVERKGKLLKPRIEEFYEKEGIESPGVETEDYLKAMEIDE